MKEKEIESGKERNRKWERYRKRERNRKKLILS